MTRLLKPSRLLSAVFTLSLVGSVAACTGTAGSDPSEPGSEPNLSSSASHQSLEIGTGENGEPICGSDLAEETFRYGLCVCGDLNMAGSLKTSSNREGTPDFVAGGVGVNGNYELAGNGEIDGTLVTAGSFAPVGFQSIGSELRVGGDVNSVGRTEVAGNAFVAGTIDAIGLDITGTLYTQEEQDMFFISAGETEVLPIAIDAPCDCENADDVVGFVAEAAASNDNAAMGVDADVLQDSAGDHTLEVGPGRVYLSGIDMAGVLTFRVTGPTAVYIGGDLNAAGLVDVEFADDDAELNIFIDGSISTAGQLELGTDEDPSRVRIYMSGNGDIDLAGGIAIRGGLSAPNSVLSTAGDVILEGAILIGDIDSAGQVTINYDTGFIDTDSTCEDVSDPETDERPDPAPEGTPADEPEAPADPETPAPADDAVPCDTSLECADPQICIAGTCGFLPL